MKQLKIYLHCRSSTNNALKLEVMIDDRSYFVGKIGQADVTISFEYDSNVIAEHVLKLIIDGKRELIDTLDDTDCALMIKKIEFNDLDVTSMCKGIYRHNFNGIGDQSIDEVMINDIFGFDGALTFSFHTPLSYWVSKDYPY